MFLCKLEAVTEEAGTLVVVMLAESDEKAFSAAEAHIRREFEKKPTIANLSLVEKKYVEKGKGYVIQAIT